MIHALNITTVPHILGTGLSGNDSAVFDWIAFRSFKGQHDVPDNNETVGHYLEICVKTVTRALKRLAAKGLIIIKGVGRWRRLILTDAGLALAGLLGQGVQVIGGQGVPVSGADTYNTKKTLFNNGKRRRERGVKREKRRATYSCGNTVNGAEADALALRQAAALMAEMQANA